MLCIWNLIHYKWKWYFCMALWPCRSCKIYKLMTISVSLYLKQRVHTCLLGICWVGHQDDILNKEVSSQDLWQKCLLLCLRLEVYDYHRLIGFLERLERREKGQRVSTISVLHNQCLKGSNILQQEKACGVQGSHAQDILVNNEFLLEECWK